MRDIPLVQSLEFSEKRHERRELCHAGRRAGGKEFLQWKEM